jgi:hypothetical protein
MGNKGRIFDGYVGLGFEGGRFCLICDELLEASCIKQGLWLCRECHFMVFSKEEDFND